MSISKKVLLNSEQVRKGNLFIIEIPKIKIEEFSMIILTLTNLKSSQKRLDILDISTAYNTNDIYVTFCSDDEISNKETLKYAVDINTMDLKYEIKIIGNTDVVTIYGEDLKNAGLIEDEFEFNLKVEF